VWVGPKAPPETARQDPARPAPGSIGALQELADRGIRPLRTRLGRDPSVGRGGGERIDLD
jgi:hypothetical protein